MTGQGSDAEIIAGIRARNAAQAARDRARDPVYGAPGVITAGPDGAVRVRPAGPDGGYDPVHHPAHYTSHPSGVECITITEHMSFCLGSALKYLFRRNEKGSLQENLEKAAWYIRREIGRRTAEVWAPFVRDERYEISSAGNVRHAGATATRRLVPLKNGYLTFMTIDPDTRKSCLYYAHRAVAETFLCCPLPANYNVCHRNGNRAHNHVTNLRIDTPAGNARDRRRHGTHNFGERNCAARLLPEQVAEIRLRRGEGQRLLAAEFGVSRSTIGRIHAGHAWRDPRLESAIVLDRWLEYEPASDIKTAFRLVAEGAEKGSEIQDLEKAVWYIRREIDRLGKGA